MIRRLLVAHPGESPAHTGHRLEREQRVRRREAAFARAQRAPSAIEENAASSLEAREHVGAAEVQPDDFIRHRRVRDAAVRDVMIRQRRTIRGADAHLARVRAEAVGFDELLGV